MVVNAIVGVLDSLDPTVRESDSVATRGCKTMSGLTLLEACSLGTIVLRSNKPLKIPRGLVGLQKPKNDSPISVLCLTCPHFSKHIFVVFLKFLA